MSGETRERQGNLTTREILQAGLPFEVPARLPGVAPLDPADWILVDEAFGAQMGEREALLTSHPDKVLACDPAARPAAEELLAEVLEALRARPDYEVGNSHVTRPDGVRVPMASGTDPAPEAPLALIGRLVQQDFCLMEKRGDEHVLTGAVLCFPASWTLAEKFRQPLLRIHVPVPVYDEMLARRVQRLFDGIQPGRPLWRANHLRYAAPTLFAPVSESAPPAQRHPEDGAYIRSERQSLWRLPESRAVAFGIHTFMIRA